MGFSKGAVEIKNDIWFDLVDWSHVYNKRYEPFYVPKIKEDNGLMYFDKEFTNMNINSLEQEEESYKKLEGFTWGTDSINQTSL